MAGVATTVYDLEQAVRDASHPLTGAASDLDPLMDLIGDARCVLLGEATHGTHEFYDLRAALTMRLIEEKGFAAVAVEADWPDAYRVNRYIRGLGADRRAEEAMGEFHRFPRWMWRNTDTVALVERLRRHNLGRVPEERAGFYGLDLYSLHSSIAAVVRYLDRIDPGAAQRARERYACFERFGENPQTYGYATTLGLSDPCREEAVAQLIDLRRSAEDYLRRDGYIAEEEQFFAEQNARVAANAEAYYRSMFGDHAESWNRRDRHMFETLENLGAHLAGRAGGEAPPRIIVWAHNSHIGDARATEAALRGELNIGQLVRERYGHDAVLIGFSTHTGTVAAADEWDGPVRKKRIRPGLPGSVEELFHDAHIDAAILPMRPGERGDLSERLDQPMLHRAIGVIYRPETERGSHYFHAHLSREYDAVIHIDRTTAVEPLDPPEDWGTTEPLDVPETFPFGE